MKQFNLRFAHVLLVALALLAVAVVPAFAQTASPSQTEEVRLFMRDGWRSSGIHVVANDFVIVCPTEEVLEPDHPCSERNSGQIDYNVVKDLVLVCPVKEVLDAEHPCSERNIGRIDLSAADDFVLVCPIQEVLDPSHPCSQASVGKINFDTVDDYVLVCPVKEVLDPSHPCSERNRN